jgi:hypothetical protein
MWVIRIFLGTWYTLGIYLQTEWKYFVGLIMYVLASVQFFWEGAFVVYVLVWLRILLWVISSSYRAIHIALWWFGIFCTQLTFFTPEFMPLNTVLKVWWRTLNTCLFSTLDRICIRNLSPLLVCACVLLLYSACILIYSACILHYVHIIQLKCVVCDKWTFTVEPH